VSDTLARQLAEMGIRDERLLEAVQQIPRRLFVPPGLRASAEANGPLPIGYGQTISQPYIAAFMTEVLRLQGGERVLELGTGSGYQTALLAWLAAEVYSIEIVPELAERASEVLLEKLHLENVHLRTGDGRAGWPEEAPFDCIMVTAAPEKVPARLLEQLVPGGRMVIPVGRDEEGQTLRLLERGRDGVNTASDLLSVRFVPLTGGP
jgi:protein-L-isoaspartate(D-aspartate) O-methyltransferase